MANYSVYDVADWFLSKESMTPKKLQKLCYYAEAWSQALYEEGLIHDSEFEAWVHGPVSPELYREYKDHKWNEISKTDDNSHMMDNKALDLLESVWVTYGRNTANELEALTHTEAPWINARRGLGESESSNNKISPEDMKNYYSSIYIGD